MSDPVASEKLGVWGLAKGRRTGEQAERVMAIKPFTLIVRGKAFQDVTVQIDQAAASALRDEGLSTSDVVALLTEALSEIEDLPTEGEALAVVVADVMLDFKFTATGLIVTKLAD